VGSQSRMAGFSMRMRAESDDKTYTYGRKADECWPLYEVKGWCLPCEVVVGVLGQTAVACVCQQVDDCELDAVLRAVNDVRL
jgi:hypothetical protein